MRGGLRRRNGNRNSQSCDEAHRCGCSKRSLHHSPHSSRIIAAAYPTQRGDRGGERQPHPVTASTGLPMRSRYESRASSASNPASSQHRALIGQCPSQAVERSQSRVGRSNRRNRPVPEVSFLSAHRHRVNPFVSLAWREQSGNIGPARSCPWMTLQGLISNNRKRFRRCVVCD